MWTAEIKGRADKPPMVFIHGAGGSHRLFGYQMQAFRDLETCYFIDLPGHGSSPPPASAPSIALYSDEVIAYLNGLGVPVTLIGHSMGGAVALQAALTRPDLVDRLVLLSTGCQLPVPETALLGLESDYEATLDKILQHSFSRTVDPDLFARVCNGIRKTDPAIVRADFQACNAFNVCGRLHEVACPTLIICGDNDRMTPLVYSEQLHTSIANSRLEVVPGGSHMLMLEEAALLNEMLK
jgi:pimeloyl-ACP methyl ester carboxylesterase